MDGGGLQPLAASAESRYRSVPARTPSDDGNPIHTNVRSSNLPYRRLMGAATAAGASWLEREAPATGTLASTAPAASARKPLSDEGGRWRSVVGNGIGTGIGPNSTQTKPPEWAVMSIEFGRDAEI
jgi:hypothetical protein